METIESKALVGIPYGVVAPRLTDSTIFDGLLLKRGRGNSGFQSRHFVVRDGVALYFRGRKHGGNLKTESAGGFLLHNAEVVPTRDARTLQIQTPRRLWVLQAPSAEVMLRLQGAVQAGIMADDPAPAISRVKARLQVSAPPGSVRLLVPRLRHCEELVTLALREIAGTGAVELSRDHCEAVVRGRQEAECLEALCDAGISACVLPDP